MNIKSLLDNYIFHDSLVEKIEYDANKKEVVINIDFCAWMQEDYNDDLPETKNIKVIFMNVIEFDGLTGDVDDFSILDVSYSNGIVVISMLDDFHDKYYEVRITADTVTLLD